MEFKVGDSVTWKVGRGRSRGFIVQAYPDGHFQVQNHNTGMTYRKAAKCLFRDADVGQEREEAAQSNAMAEEEGAEGAGTSGAFVVTPGTTGGASVDDGTIAGTSGGFSRWTDELEKLDQQVAATEDQLIAALTMQSDHAGLARALTDRIARMKKKMDLLADSYCSFLEGMRRSRRLFPEGSTTVIGSNKCKNIDTSVLLEPWNVLDRDNSFERFWDSHGEVLMAKRYEVMQAFEYPLDLPAYTAFSRLLSRLATDMGTMLGGSNLAMSPTFLIPPHSTLHESIFSDGDLIPDFIWSSNKSLSAHTAEQSGDLSGEVKSFKVCSRERGVKFKEAIGQLFKVTSLLYGRLVEKYNLLDDHQFTSIATDGVYVQICFTRHTLKGEKSLRYLTPTTQIVHLGGLTEIGVPDHVQKRLSEKRTQEQIIQFTSAANTRNRKHRVETQEIGFKYLAFAIFKCLETRALQAASEEEADPFWHKGQNICIKAIDSFRIGHQILHFSNCWHWCQSNSEFKVSVEQVIRVTHLCVVLHVALEGMEFYLKLGPKFKHRDVALTFGALWEEWYQVERDMFFRERLCSHVCASAFPVVVEGCNRPALMMDYVGISLVQLSVTCEEVNCMSRELHDIICHASWHGVSHNDISPRNVCYSDGHFHLIDWGVASGADYWKFALMVRKAFPLAGVFSIDAPRIIDLEFASDASLDSKRDAKGIRDLESLLFCCLKLLNGKLPWSEAAGNEDVAAVLHLRDQTRERMIADPHCMQQDWIFKPVVDNWLHGCGLTIHSDCCNSNMFLL